MSTNGTDTAQTAVHIKLSMATPEQLSLLATDDVPAQFRLDERTRRSGLAHVAALRAQIIAQAATRSLSDGARSNRTPANRTAPRQIAA